jgi:hypothetical protein
VHLNIQFQENLAPDNGLIQWTGGLRHQKLRLFRFTGAIQSVVDKWR